MEHTWRAHSTEVLHLWTGGPRRRDFPGGMLYLPAEIKTNIELQQGTEESKSVAAQKSDGPWQVFLFTFQKAKSSGQRKYF